MDFENLIIRKLDEPDMKGCMNLKYEERITKSKEYAKKIRMVGNDLYTKMSNHNDFTHESICDSYLTSISLAPDNSESLATSYGNFSALLYHLCKYKECIGVLEKALKITESIPLKVKLLCRTAKCMKVLQNSEYDCIFKEAELLLNEIDDKDIDKKDLVRHLKRAKKFLDKEIINEEKGKEDDKIGVLAFESNHMEILAEKESNGIFKSIAVKNTPKHGTHLVTTKDIKPGEIISVTKPYVTVPNYRRIQNICNNCLNPVWYSVPCHSCPCAMYCSEECRNEALQKFHDVECGILQFILSGDNMLDYPVQISLRAVIMSLKEFKTINELREEINKAVIPSEPEEEEDLIGDKFNPNSFQRLFAYKNIYVEPASLDQLVIICCRALLALARFTSFFGEDQNFETINSILENKNVIFIGSLLLKVAVIAHNNSVKVTETNKPCVNNVNDIGGPCVSENPCCERGYTLNTLSCLIPHSCNPNVKTIKTENGKEILYALLPIRKGYSLFECYGSTFFQTRLTNRYEETSRILNKNCQCTACVKNWSAVLAPDDQHMNFDDILDIVVQSREYDFQKRKFVFFLKKFGVAHQIVVNELSDILIASYNYFHQPSAEVCAAICMLHYAFDELYGLKYNMPRECTLTKRNKIS